MYSLDTQLNKVNIHNAFAANDRGFLGVYFKSIKDLSFPVPKFIDGSLDGLITYLRQDIATLTQDQKFYKADDTRSFINVYNIVKSMC